jgi:hypothetical protein
VIGLIERHRNKGLPSPIDADVLARAGMSPSLIPRTMQSLVGLDLITEDGQPSEALEGLRLAPESEYKQRLAQWLTGAYADALQFVDPATDDEIKIRDAFRSYRPVGQQSRMVTLFGALFAYAGIAPERVRPPAPRNKATSPKQRPAYTAPQKNREQRVGGTGHTTNTGLPPALAGMIASLAADGPGWSAERRDQFVAALRGLIDFCFPVGAAKAAPTADTADDGL